MQRINDDWFIQLFYINNDLDQSDNNPTLDDDPACNGSTVGVVNDGMNDPARDLDGGDHTGFIFTGSGLTTDYVVTRDNCPSDFINPFNGTVSPNLVRMMDIEYNTTLNGDYDPSTPQNLELLGIGSPSCSTPAMPSIGDNDYFILEFTAKDIYAMYDDGDASNGDGKKDFLREFFTGNCDQDVSFTWDIGANTQGEFTDYGMLLSGMKVINYKEDVTFYSDEFQCPKATCDTGAEDLGFTISWVGHDCESPETTDFSGYPAWLTPEMLADAITVAEDGLADPNCPESSCYNVMLDIDQFMPPACDLTAYTFEVCHTVETCSESCDGDNSYTYCRTFTTEREHVPNSDRSFAENGFDDLLQLGCIESDKLYFDECKLYDFFNPYTLAADGGFPSDAGAVVNADGHIACDAFDCDQANPSDPDGDLGSWSVPAPFSTYIIQNGSEFAVLQNIWTDYTGGAFDPCSYSAPMFDSYADFGLPNPNEAYPCSENSDKQLLIPVEYTFKACSLCEEEVLVRYLHITRAPEVALNIPNSPGVCPQDITTICLEEDCEWPNCTFDLILTNAGSHYLAAADGDLAGGTGLPALPNDCDEANCGGIPAAMAPGITMVADCDGNGTPGIQIDWAILSAPGGYLDQIGEQLLGDFNLELIVYCGVGACGTDPGAYCSDSDNQDLFFLGEASAVIGNPLTVCDGTSVELEDLFIVGATTPGGLFEVFLSDGVLGTVSGPAVNVTDLGTGVYDVVYTVGATTDCAATFILDNAVTVLAPLTVTFTDVMDANCSGNEDGAATANATGVAPFTYLWSTGATTQTVDDLHAGGYTVTVTDANGCSGVGAVQIDDPSGVTLVLTNVVDPDCNGNAGTATLQASSDNGPYDFAWSTGSIDDDLDGLITISLNNGTYVVTVTDDNGCTAEETVEIDQPTLAIVEIIDIENVSCNGGSDGSATANPAGGTTSYSYLWTNSLNETVGVENIVTGLGAGTYTVEITDGSSTGCTATATVTITEPTLLTITEDGHTDPTCDEGADGTILVTTAGGTAPYTYVWTDGSASEDATGLSAGTYNVIVTDANGCSATLSSDIVLVDPSPIVASATPTDADCAGNQSGSVVITHVSGGTADYTVTLSTGETITGIAAQGSVTFNTLATGGYIYTISDANGCNYIGAFEIADPTGVTLVVTAENDVDCNAGSTGSAAVTASGGVVTGGTVTTTEGYQFNWGTGITAATAGTTSTASNLAAGLYVVTVTDDNGCSAVQTVEVEEPAALNAVIVLSENISCNGLTDGSVVLDGTGGTAPYLFTSTGGTVVGNTVSNLDAGVSYTFTVTDANNCTNTVSTTLTEPSVLEITSIIGTDALCDGGSDGSIAIIVAGGTEEYHYLWSNGSTDFVATGLSAGTYTITVTDENGCTASATETIDDPDPIVITIEDITNADCDGGETGEAEVSAVGGTGAITFDWSNGDSGAQVWGLHAGGYSVTATDANGCTAQVSLFISDPNGMSMEVIESSQPWCHGDANGSITLGILQTGNLGGTPPYELTSIYHNGNSVGGYFDLPLTFSGNTLYLDDLEAGQYSFVVQDDNGCEVAQDFTMDEPHLLTAEIISTTDALCNGSADGTATVNATGGTTGYTYEWSNGQTSATATGLTAGIHTVTVTDANDCEATATATIGEPDVLQLIGPQSITNVSCNGGSDGAIYLSVTGGTGTYNYTWSGGQPADNVQDALNIPAGTYSVTVTDANGCTDAITGIVVTEPDAISVDIINVVNANCAGNEDGSAEATATGGTGTLTYAWSNGDDTAVATALHAGGYSVTVTDENGCTEQASVSITDPTAMSMEALTNTSPSCNGGTDGSVTLAILQTGNLGGTPPYTLATIYKDGNLFSSPGTPFPGVNGDNPLLVSNLGAGQYSFIVVDANGCEVVEEQTISEPTLLIAETIHTTDALCNGSLDGTATVNATGGTTGYTYAWSSGATTATATGLAAGNYTVTVTDANGCEATSMATIGEPTPVIASVTSTTNVSCNGDSDGSIEVSVNGGTPPYSYAWTGNIPADDVQDALNIPAGTYGVVITDSNGCTTSISNINITEPSPVVVTIGNVVNADCIGNETGSAVATASGGTGSIYNYAWSNGQNGTNQATATGLHAGGYSVTVTDENGCTAEASTFISDPNGLLFEVLDVTNVTCNGDADGSIQLGIEGGTAPYTLVNYFGSGTVTLGTPIVFNTVISGLPAGSHTFVAADVNGCIVVTHTTIDEPTLLIAEIIATTDALCNGSADGTATVNATGGTTGYTYAWPNGQTTAMATGLATGSYTVTVTDANGCEATATAVIAEPIELTASTPELQNVSCNGGNDGKIYYQVMGGTAPYSYNWTGFPNVGGFQLPDDVQDQDAVPAGTYNVVITDANGCTVSITDIVITEPTPVEVTVTNMSNADCAGTANGSATVEGSGGTAPYDFDWSTGLSVVNLSSSTATDLTAGGYSVTVTDANGCTAEVSLTIADPLALEANISATTDVSCNGGNDGSATVNASGGSGTYNYVWSDGQTTATATNLTAGLYTVVVSDPNGSMCDVIVSVTIDEPTALLAEIISSTNETCDDGNDGSATVNATGGTTGYTYAWPDGQTTAAATNLADGTYTVTVTDGNSCETTATVTIEAGPVLAIADISDVNVCPGAAVAAISLSSIPPNADVVFTWTAGGGLSAGSTPAGGSQNPEIPGFVASTVEGTYTITVTATLGNCVATTTFDVIVDDTEAPVFINCPSNIVVGNDPDNCSATVNWTIPAATDGCAGLPIVPTASTSNAYAPGDDIPVGVHTIEYIATDGNGNTSTCTFTITVLDTEAPEFITTLPADETVECDAIPDPFVVIPMMHTADNCTASADITVDYSEEIIDMVCANTYTIVRTWTITDAAGNTAEHKQKVYVQDTTAPTFTVPADVTIECDEATTPANTGDVTDAMDNCDPAPVVAFTDVEDLTGCGGYTGTITRTWTVTDACGNVTTKVQVITVEDNIDPVAICQNITVELDANGLVVISANQINNGSTDNCADPSDLTLSLSKSMFDCSNVGDNLVTLTVTDPCGNFGVCVATVTVEDNIAPVITCPSDMVIHLDPGACEQVLSFDVLATDNCDVTVTQIGGLFGSGDGFPIGGPYVLTYEATDAGGNTAQCSFSVTVFEYVPTSNDLTCNSLVNLSLDENCEAIITADQILEGNNYGCYEDYIITVTDANGNIVPGNLLTIIHVGTTVTVSITDPVTGISCWGEVYVEDKLIPEFDCPADIDVTCIDATAPSFTGEPVLTSCEASITTNFDDLYTDYGCPGDPNDSSIRATIVRTWTVTDDSGNSSTCTQTINVLKPSLSDVEFPEDNDNISGLAIECSDVANDPTLILPGFTGYPQIANQDITPGGLCAFSIGYEDTELQVCPGGASYEIIRTWTVRNLCEPLVPGVNPLQHLQSILVIDTEGPTVIAPADITISTSGASCDINFVLPSANISDICSGYDAVTVTPYGTLGSNGGTVPQSFGLGTHTITYIGTDGCGNVGFDLMTVTVEDQIAPIAICDENTSVAIGTDGTASINAITFDDGSHDNCSDVTFSVRKMVNICDPTNTAFGPSVSFCCEEVGTIVMVELRVTDEAGNINACMVEVEVEDKINPTVICAADKDIDCSATYLDYIEVGQPLPAEAITANGEAIASDNCTGVTLTNNVISNTVDCGNGIVIIVWTATDGGGRTSSCIQEYNVTNNDQFNIVDTEHRNYLPLDQLGLNGEFHTLTDGVEWPVDYEATTCGNGLEPEDLSSPYDYPIIYEGACDNIAVGHHDQLLDFGAADACLKILRKWHVIDWCQASANQDPTQPGPGVWHYTQIIKVVNSNEPNVTVVDLPSVVDNYEEDCGETFAEFTITVDDDCTAQADIDVTWEFSTGLSGTGLSASGEFANGSYSVTFTVSDLCGNTVWEIHDFTVVDAKKPTPVCIFGIATTVMPSAGSVTISAADFESGSSYDNCTAYDDLVFSFSQDVNEVEMIITCDDVPPNGLVPVTLYVTDEAGNFDFCSTFIEVQDPNIVCPDPTGLITGIIENEFQEVIEEVTVTLSDDNGMNIPVITGPTGVFQFNQTYGDYDVTPEKDINYLNGVTTYDLVLISKHILGLELLDSPYKMIAADANNSESITALDLVKIRALILYLDDELSNNTSWRFVEQEYIFPDPTNPWLEEFPEFIGLTSTIVPANFTALKVGDVNGSASPNSLLGSDTRTFSGNLALQLEATKVAEGETFTVDFKAKDFKQIAGYQFTLAFDNDAVDFVDVRTNLEGLGNENFGLTKLEEGVITTSWNSSAGVDVEDNTVLFSMTFSANTTLNTADVFTINSRYTESEAYNGTDLFDVVLEFNGNEVEGIFELYQNIPNPFKEETTISFNLPKAGAVTLRITDVAGRTLRLINMDAVKGMNSVNLTRKEFDATGVLYYQLESADNTATMKMIIVD